MIAKFVLCLCLLAFVSEAAACSTFKNCGPCATNKCFWNGKTKACVAACPTGTTCVNTAAKCPTTAATVAAKTTAKVTTAPRGTTARPGAATPRPGTATPRPGTATPAPPTTSPFTTGISLGHSIRMLEIVGRPVSVDLSSAFNATKGSLVFSAAGFPPGSGLKVDAKGVLSGTPNAADRAAPQPLRIQITGAKGPASGTTDLLLSILGAAPKSDAMVGFFTYAGMYVAPVDVRKELGLTGTCTYTLSGIPAGSGLGMNMTLGIFGGVPLEADLYTQQPLVILITAKPATGASKVLAVVITVVPYDPIADLQLPAPEVVPGYQIYVAVQGTDVFEAYKQATAGWCADNCNKNDRCVGFNFDPISTVCGLLEGLQNSAPSTTSYVYIRLLPAEVVLLSVTFQGVPFSFNFSKTVTSKNAVTYSVRGLPAGTGFKMSNQGILSGSATAADANAAQPLNLFLVARDPKTAYNASVRLILTVGKREPQGDVTATLGAVGQRLTFPVSAYFPGAIGNWTITTTGLPKNSKLTVEDGVLNGVLTEVEQAAPQPIYVVVNGKQGTGANQKSASVTVILTVIKSQK